MGPPADSSAQIGGQRRLSRAVDRILERLAGSELNSLLGGDLDFSAGCRDPAQPRGSGPGRKRAEADQLNGVALLHRAGNRGDQRINRLGGDSLAVADCWGDGIHKTWRTVRTLASVPAEGSRSRTYQRVSDTPYWI